jgi:hypothetical protein
MALLKALVDDRAIEPVRSISADAYGFPPWTQNYIADWVLLQVS